MNNLFIIKNVFEVEDNLSCGKLVPGYWGNRREGEKNGVKDLDSGLGSDNGNPFQMWHR